MGLVENMITKKSGWHHCLPQMILSPYSSISKAEKAGIPIIDLDVRLDEKATKKAGLNLITLVSITSMVVIWRLKI